MLEGPGADSEEKREPASDINIAVVDSLKALDPERPIREADISDFSELPIPDIDQPPAGKPTWSGGFRSEPI